jgi:hypothetical protein
MRAKTSFNQHNNNNVTLYLLCFLISVGARGGRSRQGWIWGAVFIII